MYSSGGIVKSVPGRSRSTKRGDCPDEMLEGAVVWVRRVSMLSTSKAVVELSTEPGMKWSSGAAMGGAGMYEMGCGIE